VFVLRVLIVPFHLGLPDALHVGWYGSMYLLMP
jgi:hypothetical protein